MKSAGNYEVTPYGGWSVVTVVDPFEQGIVDYVELQGRMVVSHVSYKYKRAGM